MLLSPLYHIIPEILLFNAVEGKEGFGVAYLERNGGRKRVCDQSEMRAYSWRNANKLGPRELPLTCPRILGSCTTLKMKDDFKNVFAHMEIEPECDPGYYRAGQESAVIEIVRSFCDIGRKWYS